MKVAMLAMALAANSAAAAHLKGSAEWGEEWDEDNVIPDNWQQTSAGIIKASELVTGEKHYHPTKVQLGAMNILAYNHDCAESPGSMGQNWNDYADWYVRGGNAGIGHITNQEATDNAPQDVNWLLHTDHGCIIKATAQRYFCDETHVQTTTSRDRGEGDKRECQNSNGGWDLCPRSDPADYGAAWHLFKSDPQGQSSNPWPSSPHSPISINPFYEVFPTDESMASMASTSYYRDYRHICVVAFRGSDDLKSSDKRGDKRTTAKLKLSDPLAGGPDGQADVDDTVDNLTREFWYPANCNGAREHGARDRYTGDKVTSKVHHGFFSYYQQRVEAALEAWHTNKTECGLWMWTGHSLGGAMAALAGIRFDPKGCPPKDDNLGTGECGDTLRQRQGQIYTFGALAVFYNDGVVDQSDAGNWNGGFRMAHYEDPAPQFATVVGTGAHEGFQHRGGGGYSNDGAVHFPRQGDPTSYIEEDYYHSKNVCTDGTSAFWHSTIAHSAGCNWNTHRMWNGAYMYMLMNNVEFWTNGPYMGVNGDQSNNSDFECGNPGWDPVPEELIPGDDGPPMPWDDAPVPGGGFGDEFADAVDEHMPCPQPPC